MKSKKKNCSGILSYEYVQQYSDFYNLELYVVEYSQHYLK